MRLIIDPGALSKPEPAKQVPAFLAASSENQILFSDFALKEAFNGANRQRIIRTFAPVRDFSPQMWALRLTPQISQIEPNEEDPARGFIDELQSNRLRAYLHDVFTDADGIGEFIAIASGDAEHHFESLMPSVPLIKKDIERFLGSLPAADLAKLRKENIISPRVADATIEGVTYDMALLMKERGDDSVPEHVENSFMFRFIVANYVLSLFWGVLGGLDSVKLKKLRNDVTDTTYATFATFYDGLITNDHKLRGIYGNTRLLLKTLFSVKTGAPC